MDFLAAGFKPLANWTLRAKGTLLYNSLRPELQGLAGEGSAPTDEILKTLEFLSDAGAMKSGHGLAIRGQKHVGR
jgi:hypothetical protein